MDTMVLQQIFAQLITLGIFNPISDIPMKMRSKVNGVMDLVVERHDKLDDATGKRGVGISLANYYVERGVKCSDPVIEVVIYPTGGIAEALTFEQSSPACYIASYKERGLVQANAHKNINSFLHSWLQNLVNQGHGCNWISE